jgi:hypothetical protein
MAMRRLHIAMDEVLEAMQERSEDIGHFVHGRTGEVGLWVDSDAVGDDVEQLDPEDPKWHEVPRLEPHDAFRVMERFIAGLDELDVQNRLRNALQRPGPFRQFRDALRGMPDLAAKWETFERDDLLQRAVEWLRSLDIEPVYELRRRPVPTAPAPTKPKQPQISLDHMLMLGAPNGRNELHDGQVVRCVRIRPASRARKMFERVAAEILERNGFEFRKSLVEGRDHIEVGPFRFVREGEVLWLAVDVATDVWNVFAESEVNEPPALVKVRARELVRPREEENAAEDEPPF